LSGHTLICRPDGLLTHLCLDEFHVGCYLSCCCTDAPDCLDFLLAIAFDRCEFLGSLLPFAAPAMPAPGLICLAFAWVPNLLPNAARLSSRLLRRLACLSSQLLRRLARLSSQLLRRLACLSSQLLCRLARLSSQLLRCLARSLFLR
jgi:hypothetical protein